MTKQGKKYQVSKKLVDKSKIYSIEEGIKLLKETSFTKFDETVEIAIKTNANPKYNDQMIRATTVLPHGIGKSKKIAVFVGDEKQQEAKDAWADIVEYKTLLNDIKNGKINFDILITTPELIRELATVAKVLGPKGLMPSPKAGTLTQNIKTTVEEFKKWKMEFRLDKTGNIHAVVWKVSFDQKKLEENIESFIKTIFRNKPTGIKGKLIKKIVISSTMGPGIQIEEQTQ